MKTASNAHAASGRPVGAILGVLALVLFGGVFAAVPLLAQAQDTPVLPGLDDDVPAAPTAVPKEAIPTAPAKIQMATPTQGSATPPAVAVPPSPAGLELDDEEGLPAVPPGPAGAKKPKVTEAEVAKLLSQDMGSTLVNEQVVSVVKKLQATGDASMEDMNQARALLARLEVMTSIVEKLAQLQQADRKRKEAMNQSSSSVAGMLPSNLLKVPASAVNTPALAPRPVASTSEAPPPAVYSVTRIVGVNGDVSALIDVGRRTTTVRVGDTLPDGSEVREINNQGVRVKKNGADKMLRLSSPVAMADDKK